MKYQTILFDADGTLLDFSAAEYQALSETLRQFSLPETQEVHRLYSEANAEQWSLLEKKQVTRIQLRTNRFQRFCEKLSVCRDITQMARFYENALAHQSQMLNGADRVCQQLSQQCHLYIVTNGFSEIQMERIRGTSLLPYFKGIFISEEIGVEKPDPLFFERVSTQIPNFSKESTLIVGDSLSSDIAGGIGFGIDTCWLNPQQLTAQPHLSPTYTVTSLSQLENIILRGIYCV